MANSPHRHAGSAEDAMRDALHRCVVGPFRLSQELHGYDPLLVDFGRDVVGGKYPVQNRKFLCQRCRLVDELSRLHQALPRVRRGVSVTGDHCLRHHHLQIESRLLAFRTVRKRLQQADPHWSDARWPPRWLSAA